MNDILENTEALQIVLRDTKLKEMIVDFVGEDLKPENDEVTVENIIEVFADQFPEFLLIVAEENWVNGYTQALNDLKFTRSKEDEPQEIHKE